VGDKFHKLLKIVFMSEGRYSHKQPRRLTAGIFDVIRHSWRNEQVCPGRGSDLLVAYLPLALTLQHIEGFFLNTMNVKTGRK